jgi:hypothetical protein
MPQDSVCGNASSSPIGGKPSDDWLRALRAYFVVVALGNLAWEFLQLPLYTLWYTEPFERIAFAALHCTGGDLLIAASTLLGSLLLFGSGWPTSNLAFKRVAVSTVVLGLGYTVFSEWLNISVREVWAYSEFMPVLPPFGTGLSPLLQWLVIPAVAFWRAGASLAPPVTSSQPTQASAAARTTK